MQQAEPKPPILKLQASIFAVTILIAVIVVPWYGVTYGFHWSAWLAFGLFTLANGLAITAGYHRLWSHNSYKASPVLKVGLALFGAATLQNSILSWASGHRRHHRYVDDNDRDPYSAQNGLWYAHMGWMLRDYPSAREDFSNARDLLRDPVVVWQHRYYAPLTLGMNFLPPLAIGLVTGDIVANLLLAGVLRLVVVHHCTFFINSLAHFWGSQPYSDSNSAKDNGLLALVTYGEGYHNFHHQFQNDYRNGIRWWQFDPTKWLIAALSKLGLARELNRVPDFKIREALIAMQFKRAEQKLLTTQNTDNLRHSLEQEYQQFLESLQEWKALREQWYIRKRQQLTDAGQDWSRLWEQTELHNRVKELEHALKLQQKRLKYLTSQLQGATAA